MPKPVSGTMKRLPDGRWCVSFTYTDPYTGKRKRPREYFDKDKTKTDVKNELSKLVAAHLEGDTPISGSSIKTFDKLAAWYQETYLVAPVYSNGSKVRGLRSYKKVRNMLKPLRGYFGVVKLDAIRYSTIEAYKIERMEYDGVSITSSNRELELLNRMFGLAIREGWMRKNPMKFGDPLIVKSAEVKREYILSFAEEKELVEVFGREIGNFLRFAIETGMRLGEIRKLVWKGVDMTRQIITLNKMTTKTGKQREIPMSSVVVEILRAIRTKQFPAPDAKVFPSAYTYYKQFLKLRRETGRFTHIRFHDMRHTFCTRLIDGGMPAEQAMKLSGHENLGTFLRYVNLNQDHLQKAASAMDRLRREWESREA